MLAARVGWLILTTFVFAACAHAVPPSTAGGLQGTWRFISYESWDSNGTRRTPFGSSPTGYLVVDESGHALIQLMKPVAASAATTGHPTAEETQAAADSFAAYYGTYTVDAAQAVIRIRVEGSNIPTYLGSTQVRPYQLQGNTLVVGVLGQYRASLERVMAPP
jgi:hypothetical protein